MLVFTLVFARLAKMPSDGIPYPLFAFTALLPWQLFSYSLNQASNSLVASQQLIKKVYFPRLVIPISAVLGGLVDFALAFVVLAAMMVYYGVAPTRAIWALPLFILLAVATALAVGLWLSTLNVQFRDVRYTIPFLTQFWLFATPIAYPASLVPERWRPLVRPQPDGRRGRGVPLGAARQRADHRRDGLGVGGGGGGPARQRPGLLPAHGEVVRRRGLGR